MHTDLLRGAFASLLALMICAVAQSQDAAPARPALACWVRTHAGETRLLFDPRVGLAFGQKGPAQPALWLPGVGLIELRDVSSVSIVDHETTPLMVFWLWDGRELRWRLESPPDELLLQGEAPGGGPETVSWAEISHVRFAQPPRTQLGDQGAAAFRHLGASARLLERQADSTRNEAAKRTLQEAAEHVAAALACLDDGSVFPLGPR